MAVARIADVFHDQTEAKLTVIAMTREMASLGKDVAAGLAERLKLEVIHHELVARGLAERSQIEESEVHRFLEGTASLFERWRIDVSKLSRYTAEEILELASKGNVLIRGWGAAYLLRPITHVVCVRVCAPMKVRTKVLMDRLDLSDEKIARREIERNDAAHTRTMQEFFGANWENALNYDIVLNTERLPIELCVEQVCQIAASPAFQVTEASQQALQDRLLEARVRTILDRSLGASVYGRALEVSVAKGVVTLSGPITSGDPTEALQRIGELQGVTKIKNEFIQLKDYPYTFPG